MNKTALQSDLFDYVLKHFSDSREFMEHLENMQKYTYTYFMIKPHPSMKYLNVISLFFSNNSNETLDVLEKSDCALFTSCTKLEFQEQALSVCFTTDLPKIENSKTDLLMIEKIKKKHATPVDTTENKNILFALNCYVLKRDQDLFKFPDIEVNYSIFKVKDKNRLYALYSKESDCFIALFYAYPDEYDEYTIQNLHFSSKERLEMFKSEVSLLIQHYKNFISSDFVEFFKIKKDLFR